MFAKERACIKPLPSARGTTRSSAGFGGASEGRAAKKQPRLSKYLDKSDARQRNVDDGWIELSDVDAKESFLSKPIKPVILANGRALCIYKVPKNATDNIRLKEQFFCTDASSTAFKYPLADANLLALKTGPAVEVSLDGTVYDLKTGDVLSWCPKNNLLRSVLGALKDKSMPEALPVYPIRVEGSKIFVKLV